MSSRSRRRLLLLFAALPVVLTTTAFAYMVGMSYFEGQHRDFWTAIEWAAETITTTGYGAETHWEHPMMVLFVVGMQFVGVFLVYMLVPLLLLPLLEERFVARLPRQVPSRLRDHVVVFCYGPPVETLLEDLVDADREVVLLELDEDVARRVLERKQDERRRYRRLYVLHERNIGFLLRNVRLRRSRALLLNGSDEHNAIALLVAQELGYEREVLTLVEEPYNSHALALAAASAPFRLATYTPRHVLGAALAARASHRVQPRVHGIQQLGPDLRVAEVRIDPESEIAGRTLRQADLAARTGATVVGQWMHGVIDAHPTPDMRLEPRGILVALGSSENLDRLGEAASGRSVRRGGPFVVAGYGEVGQKVAELLTSVGEPVLIVDHDPKAESVDVVGDIADPRTLDRLDLSRARGMVLALDSDSATLFATLIIKGAAPDLPIIARVNRAENIDRIHRAGADFALSISQVAGQILAHRLLHRDALALGTDLQILKSSADRLTHRHISALDVRHRTGCSVVAVERDGEILTELDADFHFEAADAVYVCGHRSALDRFTSEYG